MNYVKQNFVPQMHSYM